MLLELGYATFTIASDLRLQEMVDRINLFTSKIDIPCSIFDIHTPASLSKILPINGLSGKALPRHWMW